MRFGDDFSLLWIMVNTTKLHGLALLQLTRWLPFNHIGGLSVVCERTVVLNIALHQFNACSRFSVAKLNKPCVLAKPNWWNGV